MPQYKHIVKFDPLDKPRSVKTVEELAAVVQRLVQKVNDDSAKLNRELLNLERTSVNSENSVVFIGGSGGGSTGTVVVDNLRIKSGYALAEGNNTVVFSTALSYSTVVVLAYAYDSDRYHVDIKILGTPSGTGFSVYAPVACSVDYVAFGG